MASEGYHPAPAPEGSTLSRAAWDEFYAIANALAQLDAPAALSLSGSGALRMGGFSTPPAMESLFGAGEIKSIEQPAESFIDGVYTFPLSGIYSFSMNVEVEPFLPPTETFWILELIARHAISNGASLLIPATARQFGIDNLPLRASISGLIGARKGDTLAFFGRGMHGTVVGLFPCQAEGHICRVAGLRI